MVIVKDYRKTAIVHGDKSISYNELIVHASGVSESLGSRDIAAGKHICIIAENCPGWIYSLYGIWYNGSVAVPVDFMSTADEITYIIDDCHPAAIIASDKTKDTVMSAISAAEHKPVMIDLKSFENSVPEGSGILFPEMNPDRTAVIIYTSGTTGSPKGVMLSFCNLHAVAEPLIIDKDIRMFTTEESFLAILPFHHVYPLQATLFGPLCGGATVCVVSDLTSEAILSACSRNHVTRIFGVPRLYAMFHKAIMAKINRSIVTRALFALAGVIRCRTFSKIIFRKVHRTFGGKVRAMMSGGSKLDIDVAKDFQTMGFVIFEGYGMTETAPSMSVQSASRNRIGTVGWVYPGGEVAIKDGEFCYRGPNVMQGYYKRPEETAAIFDEEGFLHTGDRAEIDRDGFIRITGRIKDIIVLPNGKNVNPEEMEKEILLKFPIIKDIGVIEKNGTLFAVVYPDFQRIRDSQIINIRETIKWDVIDRYNVHAAHHKKILDFTIVETDLPRTRIGKLRRFALASFAENTSETKTTGKEPDFEEYLMLKETIEEMLGRPVSASDHAELDLNMDSLDRVELQARVETNFGFSLANEDISNNPRIADLAEYIRMKKTRSETEKTDWGSILRQKIDFTIPRRHYMMKALLFVIRPVLKLYFRIKPVGISRIPSSGPVIFAPNHQSFLDGIALLALLKRRMRRKTYFFAKDRNFNSRFRQFFARKANIILININKNLKETLQQMAAIAADGNNVVIFPEGARSRDGNLMPFKKTFAIISKELSIPVVPVSIRGMYEAFPIKKKIPRPVKIRIEFLDPVMPDALEYDDIVDKTRRAIADSLESQAKAAAVRNKN